MAYAIAHLPRHPQRRGERGTGRMGGSNPRSWFHILARSCSGGHGVCCTWIASGKDGFAIDATAAGAFAAINGYGARCYSLAARAAAEVVPIASSRHHPRRDRQAGPGPVSAPAGDWVRADAYLPDRHSGHEPVGQPGPKHGAGAVCWRHRWAQVCGSRAALIVGAILGAVWFYRLLSKEESRTAPCCTVAGRRRESQVHGEDPTEFWGQSG